MSMFWKITDPEDVYQRLNHLGNWIRDNWDFNKPVRIDVRPFIERRTLSQNAMMHAWFKEMSDYFTANGHPLNPEEAKTLMKFKFLGTEDVVIGRTIIEGQLRSTASLDKGEETHFLQQVQEWAMDHGLMLTCDKDAEYLKLLSEQSR